MLDAAIFDMDGTLLRTEHLKARSYAMGLAELHPQGALGVPEAAAVAAFGEVVGGSRMEVASYLLEKFGLVEAARQRMEQLGVDAPWRALVQLRMAHHTRMLADPAQIRSAVCPNNMALFRFARAALPRVGLATMTVCAETSRLLGIVGIFEDLDFVATGDDVEHGKPDPEIYRMSARGLGVEPRRCLVVEDSPTGIRAALDAGMRCLGSVSDLTERRVRQSGLLAEQDIVADPAGLIPAFRRLAELPE